MNVAQTLTPIFTIGTSDGVSSGAGVELTYDDTANTGAVNCIQHGTGYRPLAINCDGLDINAGGASASNVASFGAAAASISTPLNLAGAVTVALPADPDTRGFIAQPFGASTYGSFGALASFGSYVCANTYWNGAWHQVDATKYSCALDVRWDSGKFDFIISAPAGTLKRAATIDATGVYPGTDNSLTCGKAADRWSVVYAATGTINTSDAREKTAVTPLTSAEIAAAKALAAEIGSFQFLDAIAAKGADGARLHIGLTVQRAIEIMQAQGLDPTRYGFICHDAWDAIPEVVESWPDEYETVIVTPAQTQDHPAIYEFTQVYTAEGMPERFANRLVSPAWRETIAPAVTEQKLVRAAGSRVASEARPAGDRYGFRTDELLLFIARGFDARLSALEAKP